MTKKVLGAKLDEKLIEEFKKAVKRTGHKQSAVIENAIKDYIAWCKKNPSMPFGKTKIPTITYTHAFSRFSEPELPILPFTNIK